ncbi:MAG: phospholipase D-like domain-containing protein [Xanthomonadales bacterium]|jgi:phosphatidylserine/phosphatidylglycerophosphate/cardiolipin synthase-like enzyme|nr:phospholipase D-like domain-containing protein [Xanthomonadales bacterium]MDH3924898.1 phospholipase D-like domain-containing protein [Xanthomonadales bacterium]MDH4000463.1 phospholipase D-like domain-containing protein [Xanthomonadales bacterium]
MMIDPLKTARQVSLLAVLMLLASCAGKPAKNDCPAGTQNLPGCPPLSAVDDPEINEIYADRTWLRGSDIDVDLIELGKQAEIPIQHARTKFLGPTDEAALTSLAVKIWMIENAEHTIDFTYYIFKTDLIGQAMLGALCNAVRRGVDVRVTVDSVGSISGGSHTPLRALQTCSDRAGFMRNAEGQLTTRKARVQVVVFNALSKVSNPNRRSHDKLLVKDGSFEGKTAVITGGRNISLDYYGIQADGSADPDPFRDAEILLRSARAADDQGYSVGKVSEIYSTLLFLLPFNKQIKPGTSDHAKQQFWKSRKRAQGALETLKGYDYFSPHYERMDEYMNTGFHDSQVRLAHELGNLTDSKVVTDVEGNQKRNPNSIMTLLAQIGDERPDLKSVRIVSPYLFLAEYKNSKGDLVKDEAVAFREWLDNHPDTTLEIITNSVLTSDNFPAQSVIDMETAPRLLLPPEVREEWISLKGADEMTSQLVNSEKWQELVNNPRLKVYETGRLDSVKLGQGDRNYGKLHAKYFLSEDVGFIGTTNFDYRSRLYNNEMGFFFKGPDLASDVHESFDQLVSISYLWGSPEWLQLRKEVMGLKGMKGNTTKSQRGWYKFFRNSGIIWLL